MPCGANNPALRHGKGGVAAFPGFPRQFCCAMMVHHAGNHLAQPHWRRAGAR
jgi:hypothetical protein